MKRTTEEQPLARYNEMRDFGTTAEPSGEVKPTGTGHSFVIQQHAATAMHYDFRLELDGVLLSWAVPKGPSLSTKERRLAVEVEDHPVDYRDFEGSIPKGEYGGGSVIVWDRGTWEPLEDPREGKKKGKLEFVLHGEKVKGKYRLVRLAPRDSDRGKNNWLLMKGKDEFVRDGKDAEVVKLEPRSVISGRTVVDVKNGVPAPKPAKAEKPAKKVAKKTAKAAATPKKRAATKRATGGATVPAIGEIAPQLATLVDDVPTGEDWVYELKYDGYRALATVDDGSVSVATRNGNDWTDHFPTIAEALSHVRVKNAVFDGEIAYVLEDGRTDFQKLQNALSGKDDERRLVYFIFDLLFYDGVDLRDQPLTARKDTLKTVLAGLSAPLKMGDHLTGDGHALHAHACKMGLEGIIAKRSGRPYRAGRGPEWVKIKCQKRQELVIVGFTKPKGSRSGVGALLLGVQEGKQLRFAGKVGTGFTQASLTDLAKRLAPLVTKEPAVTGAPRMKDATWVAPELVCEVRFTEWTREGALRHPTFQGLREDKKAADVVREKEQHLPAPAAKKAAPAAATKHEATGDLRLGKTKITHPDRVVDLTTGITKRELAHYAEASVDHFLVFAKKRPLMLVRCTDTWPEAGFTGSSGRVRQKTCFVQKHAGQGLTAATIGTGEAFGEPIVYATTRDEVFHLVQLNAVELHGWGSRLPKVDKPDWIVFDLDPDVGLPFGKVIEAAFDLRDELSKLGLTTFVKTTGGKGLHVVLPIAPKEEWPAVTAFAAAVAHGMVKRRPKSYVATMTKAARTGKIFIDHFRNGRGATAILPYSPRARAGAGVALPVSWDELPGLDPKAFDIRTVPGILADRAARGEDPWDGMLETKQTIPRELLAGPR
ncbi:MAG: ATP-dependent ligase [Labilithrix sp.]|nr:ATP-dependent ligase [Labilithrix sp.]